VFFTFSGWWVVGLGCTVDQLCFCGYMAVVCCIYLVVFRVCNKLCGIWILGSAMVRGLCCCSLSVAGLVGLVGCVVWLGFWLGTFVAGLYLVVWGVC